ncbi:MAG: dethiobiotin synthase, partial [Candidatus Acidiferrales bacterium]
AALPRDRALPEAYRFAPPVSPHLAARRAGVRIELRKIKLSPLMLDGNLIVEGAGGALVPINDTQLMTDLMWHLKLPALLVARTSLGTINHTLLSVAALRAAHLDLRGVIMVGQPNLENRRAVEHYGKVKVVGSVPLLAKMNRAALVEVFRRNFNRKVFAA